MNSMRALTSSVDQGSDCSTLCLLDLVEGHAWPVYGDVSKVGDPLGRLQTAFLGVKKVKLATPSLNHQCDIGLHGLLGLGRFGVPV